MDFGKVKKGGKKEGVQISREFTSEVYTNRADQVSNNFQKKVSLVPGVDFTLSYVASNFRFIAKMILVYMWVGLGREDIFMFLS